MPSVTVYFADLTHCGTVTNADTFPYGVGCIAAYSREAFGNDVSVELFKLPHELDAALRAKTPDVLCFSNYVWNYYLGSAFARHVKKAWPHVPIVMGGPNICVTPEGRHRFLQSNPWVDFYIKFEGERGFAGLLGALMDRSLDAASIREEGRLLDNVLYTVGGEYFEGIERRIADLMSIPSPYLTGLLDKFFDQGLRPLIEFTRGCPYACTFCTDFHPHRNKVAWRTADVARQEMAVLLHVRAAPRRIHRDPGGRSTLEGGDVRPCEGARALQIAGVRVERAATTLPRDLSDLISVHDQGARGRAVRLGEESVHHAPAEQGHRAAIAASVRLVAARGNGGAGRFEKRRRRAQSPGESRAERRETARPHPPCERENEAKEGRPGEDGEHEPCDRRALHALGERRPRRLEEAPVRDPRRAGGFARPAAEAALDVGGEGAVVRRQLPFDERAHEHQPAARRIVLVA